MNQVALITGSSKGIGLGIALHLARLGYQVVLNSRSEIQEDVLEQFTGGPLPVGQVTGDVSHFDQAQAMIEEVVDKYGRLDILVNNAGVTADGLLIRMKEEDYDKVLDTNLKGTFNMTRHASKVMLKQRSGTIINMSSVSGILGNAGQANYSASKAGVIGLTKATARELASRHITVNAIAPGYIETEMTEVLSDKVKQTMLDMIPLKRFGQVEEIAYTVEFLINNRYLTGQVIEVGGGINM